MKQKVDSQQPQLYHNLFAQSDVSARRAIEKRVFLDQSYTRVRETFQKHTADRQFYCFTHLA